MSCSVTPRTEVEDVPFETTDDFMNALSPRNERWRPDPLGWVYRGHSNAEWDLQPKAARRPEVFKEYGFDGYASNWSTRYDILKKVLISFRDGLDRAGIVIPTPAPEVERGNVSTYRGAEPDGDAFPLMALAQHHGLPTILLDWSRRGWVAAYFAALGAADPSSRTGSHLAVWALYRNDDHPGSYRRLFREVPGGTNPNLHAQAGLFTVHHDDTDCSLEIHIAKLRESRSKVPKPLRLTLPANEAPRLLRFLAYEGITGATLFPGPDGVVKSMRERVLWDQRP